MTSDSFYQFKLIHAFKDHLDIRSVKFDNAEELSPNTEESRMDIPESLNVWTPESGATLRINQHKK